MDAVQQARLGRYNQLCRGYDDIYRQAAMQAGISFVPYYILVMICSTDGPHTQSDIQRFSFYPKQTINSAVMRLQEAGYVELTEQAEKSCLNTGWRGILCPPRQPGSSSRAGVFFSPDAPGAGNAAQYHGKAHSAVSAAVRII